MRRLAIQQGFTESGLCQRELENYRNGKNKNGTSLILPEGCQQNVTTLKLKRIFRVESSFGDTNDIRYSMNYI